MSYRPRAFRSDLNFEIERRFREAGIDLPRPRRDIRITVPELLRDGERLEEAGHEQRDEPRE